MASRAFRNYVFRTHAWIGLNVSLFMAFLFLSGTFLVVGLELQLVGQPKVWNTLPTSERTATFGQLYDGIMAEHPLVAISQIEKQTRPWLASRIIARTPSKETLSFWGDPVDGTMVGVSGMKGLHDFLLDLHENLLIKRQPAVLLATSMSTALLVLLVTGLINYRRFWKGLFRFPPRQATGRMWLGSAHRLAAVWSLPMLFIIAVTSFVFFLEELGVPGSQPVPALAVERPVALPDGFDGAALDRIEAVARAALPNFQPQSVVLPIWPEGGIEFYGNNPDSLTSLGVYRVAVDPVTQEILGAFAPTDIKGLARIRPLVTMLHFGTWGHAASRGLWIVFGFAAFAIALTGVLIFAARQPSASTEAQMPGPLRRIWQGLGVLRWAYLLLVLAIAMAGIYTYSPAFQRPVRLQPVSPDASVYLLAKRAQRAGKAYPLTLQITDPKVKNATLQLNAGPEQHVALRADDGTRAGTATVQLDVGGNTVLIRLEDEDGEIRKVTYKLGRPPW